MEAGLRGVGIEVSGNRMWEGYRAYEKRLVLIASKDSNIRAGAARVVEAEQEQEVEQEQEQDQDQDQEGTEGSGTPTPRAPTAGDGDGDWVFRRGFRGRSNFNDDIPEIHCPIP